MARKSKSSKIIAGRYAYEKPLGKGAGGAVYLAEDYLSEESKFVALKVINAEAANSVQGTMLRREYEVLMQLDHRNLVHVYDFGTLPGGGIYLAEEYINGFSLQDARALLEPSLLIEITVQILEGLAYMHAMGTVHRDIKPANVMILWPDDPTSKPLTKLVDFGLSSCNTAGDTLRGGTRSYMAPEVIRGERAEFRSDLYSLGVTLYYAMCGVIPFGPRGRDESSVADETFRPPEPHRINPSVPLSLSRFTMLLLRQVPGADLYDAGQALRTLIEDVDERTHSDLQQFNVDVASSSVLRGTFELGLISFRDERRKSLIYSDCDMNVPGRLLLLSGPPDVGKSKLIRSIASDYKLNGATVIEVRPSYLLRRFGYAIDVISQLISLVRSSNIKGVNYVAYFLGIITTLTQCIEDENIFQDLSATDIPERLADAILYLRSLLNPSHLVIIIDNIDIAPPDQISLLSQFLESAPNFPKTTIIFSGRSGEQTNSLALVPQVEHFHLTGFELSDLKHFVYKQLGLTKVPVERIERFYETAEDDTAFIFEICSLLIEEGLLRQKSVSKWEADYDQVRVFKLPTSLLEAIEQRLENLSPDTRNVIELLSLIRYRIERSLVRSIIDSEQIHEDAEQILNQLLNRNYIVFDFLPNGCFLRVTNHTLQHFVRSSLPDETRRHYHAQIATHMLRQWDKGSISSIDIAHHLEQAGPDYYWEASVCFEEAANRLLMEAPGTDTRFIFDAVGYLERSLSLTESSGHVDPRCTLNRRRVLATALLQLGKVERARNLLEEIWSSLLALPDDSIWLQYATIVVGLRIEVVGGTPAGLTVWEERLVTYLPEFVYQPDVALVRAWSNRIQGNFALAFELVRRSKIRSDLYYSRTAVESEASFGRLYEDIGQLQLAFRHYEHALELAKHNELEAEQAFVSIGIGRILVRSNRLPEAENYIFEGFNAAVRAGRPDFTAEALIEEGHVLAKLGSFKDASRRANDALQISQLIHHCELQGRVLILQANILTQQSRTEEAIKLLQNLVAESAQNSNYSFTFRIELQKNLGRMLADNGQEEGRDLYENALMVEQSLDTRSTAQELSDKLIIFPSLVTS